MGRTYLGTYAKAKEILFGDTLRPVSIPALSKATGIPESSLRNYRSHVDDIPYHRLRSIVRARRLTEEEKHELFA